MLPGLKVESPCQPVSITWKHTKSHEKPKIQQLSLRSLLTTWGYGLFFRLKTMLRKKCWSFFCQYLLFFKDIEESTISFSDFHLCLHHNQLQLSPSQLFQCAGHEPQLQEPQHFVLLLHINQPISSMSGSQQAWTWPGLPTARPCPTPLSLRGWPPSCTTYPWGSAAPAGCAEMSIVSFQIK